MVGAISRGAVLNGLLLECAPDTSALMAVNTLENPLKCSRDKLPGRPFSGHKVLSIMHTRLKLWFLRIARLLYKFSLVASNPGFHPDASSQ